MNSIVRNFVFVISRFKMASFLNVAGLSVAFTAFLILFMQIRYEWGYDRFHKHARPVVSLGDRFQQYRGASRIEPPSLSIGSWPPLRISRRVALINQWGDKDIYHGGSGR